MSDEGYQPGIAETLTKDYNLIQGENVVQESYGQTGNLKCIRLAGLKEATCIIVQVNTDEI